MKYIKLFESYEKGYKIIHPDEFNKLVFGCTDPWVQEVGIYAKRSEFILNNWYDFTDKEIAEIKSILDNSIREFKFDILNKKRLNIVDYDQDISRWVHTYHIFSIKDEWFYLHDITNNKSYSCDQFTSLINLLNDIIK